MGTLQASTFEACKLHPRKEYLQGLTSLYERGQNDPRQPRL